jgi:hypothetical protein
LHICRELQPFAVILFSLSSIVETIENQAFRGDIMAGKAPIKDAVLRVRLTEHEDKKLRAYAARHQRSISWVIREYLRRLPRGKDDEESDRPQSAYQKS